MTIQENIRTLTEVNKEISRVSKELAKLRKQAKAVNKEITEYIIAKEQIGVKCDGNAFIVDKKTKPIAKPKKLKEQSYIEIAEKYGIDNPQEFLKELLNAGKLEKEVTKLKIQKL
jgi:septal ring factor EnvC (AmiA/AmiB activator)